VERNPYRRRIKILVEVLNTIIHEEDLSRKEVADILRRAYEKHKIKPLKGKATPPDLYDKELSSLYVIGRYGLGLDDEYPDLFNKLFYLEEGFERVIELLKKDKYEEARELLKPLSSSGVVDSNTIARMLRVPFTKLLFGFTDEEEFATILHRVGRAFPEEERTVKNYVKFYIAFKIAEEISKGLIRSKGFKEAMKKALALRLGFPRVMPSDEYIALIAREVFGVPSSVLGKILSIETESTGKPGAEATSG